MSGRDDKTDTMRLLAAFTPPMVEGGRVVEKSCLLEVSTICIQASLGKPVRSRNVASKSYV